MGSRLAAAVTGMALGAAPLSAVPSAASTTASTTATPPAPRSPLQVAADPVAVPGSFTGYGFDACTAPTQDELDAWRTTSPYFAVGVYIGGSNRLCRQPELDAQWVRTRAARGWHILPVQVGPQASCSGYEDRISPDLRTALAQGRNEAREAVVRAQALAIGEGSTTYYDLEDYDIAPDDCRSRAPAVVDRRRRRAEPEHPRLIVPALLGSDQRWGATCGADLDLASYPVRSRGSSGSSGRTVKVAQCLLRQQRFGPVGLHGRFDRATVRAVEQAQRARGLRVSRMMTRATWTALPAHGARPVLKLGSTGEPARRAQRALTAALDRRVAITGVLTKRTDDDLLTFQRRAGLQPSGVTDPATWRELQAGG